MLVNVSSRRFGTEIKENNLVIQGFNTYVFQFEGSQVTSRDETPKRLTLEVGLDGALVMNLVPIEGQNGNNELDRIKKLLPESFDFYFETSASKVIKGVRGKYFHFRNRNNGDIISYNIGAGAKPYRIVLGNIRDPQSKLRVVLEQLPDRPFKKSELVHRLPQNIVENRQPIKAALDVLEKEGYVKSVGKTGISEEYLKMNKRIPEPMIQKISSV
ncbi:MAG TPA: hypothetical protein VFF30_09605 [Nitrososphaerales archaeon]|nr:hypothetical protein [Nitrososphaerales archaeon]